MLSSCRAHTGSRGSKARRGTLAGAGTRHTRIAASVGTLRDIQNIVSFCLAIFVNLNQAVQFKQFFFASSQTVIS